MSEDHESVKIIQKDDLNYVAIEDGALETPHNQPKRKYGEKVIHGIIVGRGENKQVINIQDVKKLAALHLTYKDMADYFGVKENTFRDHFKTVCDQARQTTKQRLMQAMLHNAIDKNQPTIQIFLAKNLLGFTSEPINSNVNTSVLPWLEDEEEHS
jgi:AraC-like DNA-binding protein